MFGMKKSIYKLDAVDIVINTTVDNVSTVWPQVKEIYYANGIHLINPQKSLEVFTYGMISLDTLCTRKFLSKEEFNDLSIAVIQKFDQLITRNSWNDYALTIFTNIADLYMQKEVDYYFNPSDENTPVIPTAIGLCLMVPGLSFDELLDYKTNLTNSFLSCISPCLGVWQSIYNTYNVK